MRTFRHHNQLYCNMFNLKDDSVHLVDQQLKVYLIYTANCEVINPDTRDIVGRTGLDNKENWKFTSTNGTVLTSEKNVHRDVEGLLDFEIDISKWYLTKIAQEGDSHGHT